MNDYVIVSYSVPGVAIWTWNSHKPEFIKRTRQYSDGSATTICVEANHPDIPTTLKNAIKALTNKD